MRMYTYGLYFIVQLLAYRVGYLMKDLGESNCS